MMPAESEKPLEHDAGGRTGDRRFQAAAGRAVRRVVLAEWFRLLRVTALVALLPAVGAVGFLRATGVYRVEFAYLASFVVIWALAMLFAALARRPSAVRALAKWDENAGRHEMFVSAWCFEQEEEAGPGELLHLERARARLETDLPALGSQLPARFPHRAWLLSLLLLACSVIEPFRGELPPEERILDEAARRKAREVGESLNDKSGVLDRLKGLSEEEQEKIRKMKADLEETAGKMRQLSLKTPRDVLAELDRRAREAEKLAEELGLGDEELLSADMIAELERHADTADFAAAVRAADSSGITGEARKIAGQLGADDCSLEQQKRFENALGKSLQAGSEADRKRVIGKNIAEAEQHLRNERRLRASERFSGIAEHFERNEQREQARRQLQRLADALRASGQNMFGRNQAGVKRLQQSRYAGLQPLQYRQLQVLRTLPFNQQTGNAMPTGMALLPGQNMPGMGQNPAAGTGQTPIPGAGQIPGADQAPVPGGAGLAPGGMGQTPVPGSAACQSAMQGGLFAGRGTAPYGSTATTPIKANQTGVVEGRLNEDGPSAVRAIDGNLHKEEARRSARELAIEALRSEEEALSEEPLPLTRREQVLRYFTALRRQIENEP